MRRSGQSWPNIFSVRLTRSLRRSKGTAGSRWKRDERDGSRGCAARRARGGVARGTRARDYRRRSLALQRRPAVPEYDAVAVSRAASADYAGRAGAGGGIDEIGGIG